MAKDVFALYPVGAQPNPLSTAVAKYTVFDHSGAPHPNIKIDKVNSRNQLICEYAVKIQILIQPSCGFGVFYDLIVDIPGDLTAYDASGNAIGSWPLQPGEKHHILEQSTGAHSLRLSSTQNELYLAEFHVIEPC